jgi:hypothetical protein
MAMASYIPTIEFKQVLQNDRLLFFVETDDELSSFADTSSTYKAYNETDFLYDSG